MLVFNLIQCVDAPDFFKIIEICVFIINVCVPRIEHIHTEPKAKI
jgi:hypothetical protein